MISRPVPQISKSAVSQASKPAELHQALAFGNQSSPADLEIGGTADLEICGTGQAPTKLRGAPCPAPFAFYRDL